MLETRPPTGDSADTARGVATARGTDDPAGLRHRLIAIGVPLVLWVVVSVAGWFRLTAQVRNTVWAEDGKVFLEEQFDMGVLGALFHDYAGYLHVVPRLLVAVASHAAPIDRFAVTVSVLCVLVTGAVGAAVYVLTAGVLDSVVARVLLAFVPALVPLGPMEIQANVANLHWFLMFLVPFALLTPVRSWTKGILLGVATLLAGLTEIQVVAFFPLFLLGIRNRHRWPVIAGTVVGGAAQVVTTLMHPPRTRERPARHRRRHGARVRGPTGRRLRHLEHADRRAPHRGARPRHRPRALHRGAAGRPRRAVVRRRPPALGAGVHALGLRGRLVRGRLVQPERDARVRPLRRREVAGRVDVPLQRGRVDLRHRRLRRRRRRGAPACPDGPVAGRTCGRGGRRGTRGARDRHDVRHQLPDGQGEPPGRTVLGPAGGLVRVGLYPGAHRERDGGDRTGAAVGDHRALHLDRPERLALTGARPQNLRET
ncbi:glycosyltransferase family 87 protein [Curtobacterium sp. MCJR17_043]|uniref:glycosyltransferase family 87 protein n=1 Tax=Curtobacterium sp. MCJR17_043 TaxID=2175660 RepID=UPI0024DF5A2E|nr:glycosyltransferase family 87 protein [Curtobacterium sp. MCJR17_043]WIB35270.1 glycosyltransferase family 87 protein [Curtobacterium sp. MCJR17_043]